MIYIIDDDDIMAECIARSCQGSYKIFHNAIEAMTAIDEYPPQLIFLDILLDGPDGFTFLNEMVSYPDTATIPIIIVSSLKIPLHHVKDYGVVAVLDKSTMTPQEIKNYVNKYVNQ